MKRRKIFYVCKDLWPAIFAELQADDLLRCREVCSKWKHIVDTRLDQTWYRHITRLATECALPRIHPRFDSFRDVYMYMALRATRNKTPVEIVHDWVKYRMVEYIFLFLFCCLGRYYDVTKHQFHEFSLLQGYDYRRKGYVFQLRCETHQLSPYINICSTKDLLDVDHLVPIGISAVPFTLLYDQKEIFRMMRSKLDTTTFKKMKIESLYDIGRETFLAIKWV